MLNTPQGVCNPPTNPLPKNTTLRSLSSNIMPCKLSKGVLNIKRHPRTSMGQSTLVLSVIGITAVGQQASTHQTTSTSALFSAAIPPRSYPSYDPGIPHSSILTRRVLPPPHRRPHPGVPNPPLPPPPLTKPPSPHSLPVSTRGPLPASFSPWSPASVVRRRTENQIDLRRSGNDPSVCSLQARLTNAATDPALGLRLAVVAARTASAPAAAALTVGLAARPD